ncbi:hypothetical protein HNQ79_000103 [Streptomyces candidus]|uniref:Uncharacterized protein n=1 Tax=Streptomyces candidus TaxID=67283 RepID=A0A7X0LMA3_9ACTN|nr:hypothetical protein [Streptomyces candidus]GHH35050.1 hypothetical protein GCM10018773_08150 [Streptomyces candidus]
MCDHDMPDSFLEPAARAHRPYECPRTPRPLQRADELRAQHPVRQPVDRGGDGDVLDGRRQVRRLTGGRDGGVGREQEAGSHGDARRPVREGERRHPHALVDDDPHPFPRIPRVGVAQTSRGPETKSMPVCTGGLPDADEAGQGGVHYDFTSRSRARRGSTTSRIRRGRLRRDGTREGVAAGAGPRVGDGYCVETALHLVV